MQVVHERCCGLDVHHKSVVACVLVTQADGGVTKRVQTFGTMTADLLALADWLAGLGVREVAMESTGVYWRPVFNLLEESCTVTLVNAQHLKRVGGRKTDVKDAEWLADLLRHGLLQASFIPPAPIRELREVTRYRKTLVQARTDEVNRLHKLLEGANLKLGAVASDILGVSGRAMLEALVGGEQDPKVLAELARGRLRAKLPALRRALAGRVQPYQLTLLGRLLAHIDFLEESIGEVQAEIECVLAPFTAAAERLQTIPGVGAHAAAVIVAELGVDMAQFGSAKQLASWAGVCPGNRQSGGKRLGSAMTKGARWLKGILGEVVWVISRSPGSYLHAQFHRLAKRRGKQKAVGAVMHSLVVIIYYMLRDGTPYSDLGADYFTRRDAERLARYHVKELNALGFGVAITLLPPPEVPAA